MLRISLYLGLAALLLSGCETGLPSPDRPDDARDAAVVESAGISGLVIDETGLPVANASIRVVAYDENQSARGNTVNSNSSGAFSLTGLVDRNALLHISAENHYAAVVPLDLQSGNAAARDLGAITLVKKQTGRVRLILAGDTMFGRRFADHDEDGIEGEADDLIRPATRAQDAQHIVRFLPELISDADLRIVNFESPASDLHENRHPLKHFSYTSHPETLAGLQALDVDVVSLGNNHSYDYLEPGLRQTVEALDEHSVNWFGAGFDLDGARASRHQTLVNDIDIRLQGFNAIVPVSHAPGGSEELWEPSLLYNATPTKAGSLLLDVDEVARFVSGEIAPGRLVIPVMHGGWEYQEQPSPNMIRRFQRAMDEGALLVKAHHSHTVYGIGVDDHDIDGLTHEPKIVFMSLGNFVFDQDVFETVNSAVAVVDIELDSDMQARLLRVGMRSFHQEQYIPSASCGTLAERMGRHLGHLSTFMPTLSDSDIHGAVVFPETEGIAICLRDDEYRYADRQVSTSVSQIDNIAMATIDGATGASSVHSLPGASAQLGRDLLIYGDMEDHDIDDEAWECSRWTLSETHYPTHIVARSGRTSLLLHRSHNSNMRSVSVMRNRITFNDDAQLTLHGWYQRQGSGQAVVEIDYIERDTRNEIGTATVKIIAGGDDDDWHPFAVDLRPPAAAGHLRISLAMDPPAADDGFIAFDDLALVDWQYEASAGEIIPSPNNFTFLRLPAPATVPLILRSYERRREASAISSR